MASAGEVARFGVLALTQGNAKVALVRHGDAWGFPSLPLRGQAGSLEDELETALDAAQQQLGLDLTETMCSQPVIQVRDAQGLLPARPPPPPPMLPAGGWLPSCCCHDRPILPSSCLPRRLGRGRAKPPSSLWPSTCPR